MLILNVENAASIDQFGRMTPLHCAAKLSLVWFCAVSAARSPVTVVPQ